MRVVQLGNSGIFSGEVPAGRQEHIVAILAEILRPDRRIGGADQEVYLGVEIQFFHLLHERHAVRRRRQRKHGFGCRGFCFQDQIRKILRAGRVFAAGDDLITMFFSKALPARAHFLSPVGSFEKERHFARPLGSGDHRIEKDKSFSCQVGRLWKRRKEIAQALLMDAIKGESHTQVRNLVFIGDGSRCAVKVGACSAQIGHHSLGREGLESSHGLGRVRLVVEHCQFDLELFAADRNAACGVDMLDGNLVAGFNLTAERRVTSGERHDRAHFDGLAVALGA